MTGRGDDGDLWQQYGGANGVAKDVTALAHKPMLRSSSGKLPGAGKAESSKLKSKTSSQLRELSADLAGDLKALRANLRRCEEAVRASEQAKQAKYAELQSVTKGSAFEWIIQKAEVRYPDLWDAQIESARAAMQDAQARVHEMEARAFQVHEALACMGSSEGDGETTIFIHFIPPPLRAHGKAHLPWIVHTCDGSGCREARHVSIASITGFSTYEGAPPEQAEGKACKCQIANHHLRGQGKVRWDGEDAIVESGSGGGATAAAAVSGLKALSRTAAAATGPANAAMAAMVNGHAYKEQAARNSALLVEARDEIKRLRAARELSASQQRAELDELRGALLGKLASAEQLGVSHEALKVQHDEAMGEWRRRFAEACAREEAWKERALRAEGSLAVGL